LAALCGVLPLRVATWITGSDSMPIPRLQEFSTFILRARAIASLTQQAPRAKTPRSH
jgi:hypothetical protein